MCQKNFRRAELDTSAMLELTNEFSRSNAIALARVAQLAYESANLGAIQARKWGLEFQFYESGDTQAITLHSRSFDILAFRGTEADIDDIRTDLDVEMARGPFGSRVHSGFLDAFQSIWPQVFQKLSNRHSKPLFITGHSLGAALATLAATYTERKVAGVYTFGSPRVGNRRFSRELNSRLGRTFWRIQNNNDIVTRIPPTIMGYKHTGQLVYLDSYSQIRLGISCWHLFKDRLRGRVKEIKADGIKDHLIQNYITSLEGNYGS